MSNKKYPIKEFSSIHNHSSFSFMDGLSMPKDLIAKAKQQGLKSIALTDHGHMHASAEFYLQGRKQGVKTIFGIEAYAIDDLDKWLKEKEQYTTDKKKIKIDADLDEDATNLVSSNFASRRKALGKKGHLVLLAKNKKGLENLFKMHFLSYKDGFYFKPRIDKKMISEHSEGLIASSACMGGVIANKCWHYKNGEATWKEVVKEAKNWFEILNGNFFLELQFNESESQKFINECILKVHNETKIPLSVTNDSHYIEQNEWEAQELLYMLRGNKTLETIGDDWNFEIKQLYLKNHEQMWNAYEFFGKNIPEKKAIEAFENTLLIDSQIEDFDPDRKMRLPTLSINNPFKKLGENSIVRLKELGLANNRIYKERLLYELKMIKEKGFTKYFLIMKDIIEKAKLKMLVGPGRGSSASSLVCYLNGITSLDPIQHNLVFERFINPARCFPKETLVETKCNGKKNICNVKVGELVFTHKKKWKKVLNVFKQTKLDSLITIMYDSCCSKFECTANHKIFVDVNDRKKFLMAGDIHDLIISGAKNIYLLDKNFNKVIITDIFSSEEKKENLYDLTVEEDNSYMIFGINE